MAAVSASVKDDRLVHALGVRAASALSRRRAWADYAVGVSHYRTRAALVPLLGALLMLLAAAVGSFFPRPVPPRAAPLSLVEPTRAHGFERLYLSHRVVEGDMLRIIAVRYYGSASPENMRLLRQANPLYPADPPYLKGDNDRKLMLDSEIKIPLR